MSKVDNKIHFVWVGGTIPEEKVNLILQHLLINSPDYEVFLWTDKPHQNARVFWQTVNNGDADEANKASVSWWELGYYRTTLTFGGERIAHRAQGLHPAVRQIIEGPPKRLTFIDISGIDAQLGTLTARYRSAIKTRNYGRASDILRLGIIHKEGGIYMDTDVTPLRKLPVTIMAPEGLLIGQGQAGFIGALTNAVVAAPKNTVIVSELMRAICRQFDMFDKKKWLELIEDDLKDARKSLANAKANHDADSARIARENLQKAMKSATNSITGPEAVGMFLYYYLAARKQKHKLHKAYIDLLQMMRSRTDPYKYFDDIQQAQTLIFKYGIVETGVISSIAFPRDFLHVASETSWIKNAE